MTYGCPLVQVAQISTEPPRTFPAETAQPGDEAASLVFFLVVIAVLGFVIARLASGGLPRDPKDGL